MSRYNKTYNRIIALAYFHRYGWIAVMLGLSFLVRTLFFIFGLLALLLLPFGHWSDISAGGGIFCVLFKMLTARG